MTTEDLSALQALSTMKGNNTDLSSYEHFMMAEKVGKRPSGVGIAGLVVGGIGTALAIGSWIFGPIYAAGRANGNKALIDTNAQFARQMEAMLANSVAEGKQTVAQERAERISYASSQNPTLTDYITVSQQGSQNTSANAAASALAQAEATLLTNALTGQMQTCPQKVSLYSAPQPCSCPGSCNG